MARVIARWALVGALAVLASACGSAAAEPGGTTKVTSRHVSAPVNPVRVRISLPAKKLIAGRTTRAVLVVKNTGKQLTLRSANGCKPKLGLVVSNGTTPRQDAFIANCEAGALVIPRGQSRIHFDLPVTYLSCHPGGLQGSAPACLSNGSMPPLPAGRYRVSLDGDPVVPRPRPVRVRVTDASSDHR